MHYVDKTEQVCRVVGTGRYLFLSRPRRFGKSLTISTLNELYSGSVELFEGLWAGAHWSFAKRRRPVIWLQFASSGFQLNGVTAALNQLITEQAEKLGVDVPAGEDFAGRFRTLIREAARSTPAGRVVLLVDEYDKPIVEYLGDTERALANRDLLKAFYSVLKDADPYIELAFITGSTR